MKKLLAFGALIAATFGFAHAQVVPSPPGTVAMVCANNASVPTPTDGKFFYVQCDSNGKLITTGSGGGGGSPGGTNGQVQYNNSGSFGGFTASGDATINPSTGAVVVTKSNGTAFGTAAFANTGTSGATLGLLNAANAWSAAQTFAANDIILTGASGCATFSAGVLSSTGSACGGSGSTGANPTATAGPTAVNGSATTFMRSDGAPAVQLGTGSAPGLVQCGLGLTCTAGVAGASVTQRNNTTTSDTLLSTDAGTVVTENNASAVAVGIAVASTTGFTTGNYWTVKNKGAGVVTITPTTSTIDGAATLTLSQNQSIDFYSDGTNYWTLPGKPNGATITIASGTAALGTSAIASGACATAVTVSAPGVATTDTLTFGYNGDPTAITGYGASATGAVLSIYPYPTANNVNVKVCNSTPSSITPSAATLNFRVVR